MTKVMFQIGLLAFFVSAVIFGTQGLGVMDMIARAFIVFIAVVAGQLMVLVVASGMKRAPERPAGTQVSSRSEGGVRTNRNRLQHRHPPRRRDPQDA